MADRLYRSVKANSLDRGARFVIIDFRGVVGMDSSGVSSFVKIARAAERSSATLVFSGMSQAVAEQWLAGSEGADAAIEHFGDLDHAMEWCEDQIIEHYGMEPGASHSLIYWLTEELQSVALAERLAAHLYPRTLQMGEVLCRQGEPSEELFLIESGRIAIVVDMEGEPHRLRSLGERTFFGEMGIYRHMDRSASAFAERETHVHVLTLEAFVGMEKNEPDLAVAFHAAIVRMLANRLHYENAVVAALSQ
jgi:SulP family sulfate permease